MDRRFQLATALDLCGFEDSAEAVRTGEAINATGLLRMLRWAVRRYRREYPMMASALRIAKAWLRECRALGLVS